MPMQPVVAAGPSRVNHKTLNGSPAPKKDVGALEARVSELEVQIKEVEVALGGNEEDAAATVKRYISALHEYNECKDMTQMMLGRLADMDQTTFKAMHERFDLPLKES